MYAFKNKSTKCIKCNDNKCKCQPHSNYVAVLENTSFNKEEKCLNYPCKCNKHTRGMVCDNCGNNPCICEIECYWCEKNPNVCTCDF